MRGGPSRVLCGREKWEIKSRLTFVELEVKTAYPNFKRGGAGVQTNPCCH